MDFPNPRDNTRQVEQQREQERQSQQQQRQQSETREQQARALQQQMDQQHQREGQQQQTRHEAQERAAGQKEVAHQQDDQRKKRQQTQERNRNEALKRQPRYDGPAKPQPPMASKAAAIHPGPQSPTPELKPGAAALQQASKDDQVREAQALGVKQVLAEKHEKPEPRRELSSETVMGIVTQIFDAERPRSGRMEYTVKGEIDPAVKAVPIADVQHLADVTVRLENNSEQPIFHGLNEEPKDLGPEGKRPPQPSSDEIKRATEIAKAIDPNSRVVGALEDSGRDAAQREAANSKAPEKPVSAADARHLMTVAGQLGIGRPDPSGPTSQVQPPTKEDISRAADIATRAGCKSTVIDQLRLAEKQAQPAPERVKQPEIERDMGR